MHLFYEQIWISGVTLIWFYFIRIRNVYISILSSRFIVDFYFRVIYLILNLHMAMSFNAQIIQFFGITNFFHLRYLLVLCMHSNIIYMTLNKLLIVSVSENPGISETFYRSVFCDNI